MVAADPCKHHIRDTHGAGNHQLHGVLKRSGKEQILSALSFIFHLSSFNKTLFYCTRRDRWCVTQYSLPMI